MFKPLNKFKFLTNSTNNNSFKNLLSTSKFTVIFQKIFIRKFLIKLIKRLNKVALVANNANR